jgi:SHS2 domain-containing protein
MSYRYLDHTADLRLEIEAPSLAELLAESVAGFTEAMIDPREVAAKEELLLKLEAESAEDLLRDFLDELLFRFETEDRLFHHAEVTLTEKPGGLLFQARTWGERYNPARHGLKLLLKAVTYHGLVVEEMAEGWRAQVIFDI